MKRSLARRFLSNHEGATAIEFAFVAGIFFTTMIAIIEYGLIMMSQVVVESAVNQAGRATSIGTGGGDRVAAVQALIRQRVSGLPNAKNVMITAQTVAAGGTTAPDLCFVDGETNPPTSPTECPEGVKFIDVNGDNVYNGNGPTNLGAAGDLVEVRVSYPWHVITPIVGNFFPNDGNMLITASTVVRNEAF